MILFIFSISLSLITGYLIGYSFAHFIHKTYGVGNMKNDVVEEVGEKVSRFFKPKPKPEPKTEVPKEEEKADFDSEVNSIMQHLQRSQDEIELAKALFVSLLRNN